MGLIDIGILAAGLLAGAFAFGGQKSAEATVPVQAAESGEGWSVQSFRTVAFAEKSWRQLGQEGSCVAYSSLRQRSGDPDRRRVPSAVTVVTETGEFTREYPLKGARVLACAGFTVFLSPLNSGGLP